MPYILSFVKSVLVTDTEQYINDCCIGGDCVLEELLPGLRKHYIDVLSNQEDWGWFAWFKHAGVNLAVDIHTQDAAAGLFQVHLTSSKPRFLRGAAIQDTAELETLRDLVVSKLQSWHVAEFTIEHVDEKYMPA